MTSKTRINYDGRVFRPISNSDLGEAGSQTLFCYHESGGVVWAEYCGGGVLKGMLLAKKAEDGSLQMHYLQINSRGELKTGVCNSVLTILADGRYRLFERWRWTSGACGQGESVIEELSRHAKPGEMSNKGFSVTGLC